MIAANPLSTKTALQPQQELTLDQLPWLILQGQHERVNYQFDAITEFLGNEEHQQPGIGFTFTTEQRFSAGDTIQIGFPLPDSVRSFTASVVSQREQASGFEYGIWIPVSNDVELLTMLNSCDYLDIRRNS